MVFMFSNAISAYAPNTDLCSSISFGMSMVVVLGCECYKFMKKTYICKDNDGNKIVFMKQTTMLLSVQQNVMFYMLWKVFI